MGQVGTSRSAGTLPRLIIIGLRPLASHRWRHRKPSWRVRREVESNELTGTVIRMIDCTLLFLYVCDVNVTAGWKDSFIELETLGYYEKNLTSLSERDLKKKRPWRNFRIIWESQRPKRIAQCSARSRSSQEFRLKYHVINKPWKH